MKLRWLCFAFILTLRHSSGLAETLACYECAGYWEDVPQHPTLNNKICATDSFSPANLTITNSTVDPADPLFCFTFMVYSKDANDGQPYTIRGAQTKSNRSTMPFNRDIVDQIRSLSYSLDIERSEIFSMMETCHEDLCNGVQAATSVAFLSVLLPLLPLCMSIF
ncbi:hypothetical protein FHG87_004431 [Trinorchestia longiramus]|nr:hypothetical protein FHG87_004431 [Trinorchestia longiramus]